MLREHRRRVSGNRTLCLINQNGPMYPISIIFTDC